MRQPSTRRDRWRGEVADRLLANPVIESYRVEVGQEPVATRGAENGRGPAWRGATREEG